MSRLRSVPSVLLLSLTALVSFGSAKAETTKLVSEPTEAALRAALAEVRQMRSTGDTAPVRLQLTGGVYQLSQTIELNGEIVGEGLTIEPTPDCKHVTISGAEQLGVPTKDADGRWRYPLPTTWRANGIPRVMLVGHKLQTAARTPNEGYYRIVECLPDRRSGFLYEVNDLPSPLPLEGHVCDLVLLHDWSSSRLPVKSIDAESHELKTVGPIGADAPHYAIDHFEKQPRYYLEGHEAFADLPGEWYVDVAAEELVVVAGDDASAPNVALPVVEQLIVATGTDEAPLKHLVIQNIRFTGTRFPMPPGGMACVQAANLQARDANGDMIHQGRQGLSSAVHVEVAEQAIVRDCEFVGLGNCGLWLGSRTTDCRIEQCKFDDIGGNALNLGEDSSRSVNGQAWWQAAPAEVATNNVVTKCTISHCGQLLPGAVAIWGGFLKQLQISDNEISDCPYTGISLGWMWNPTPTPAGNNRIANNHIVRVMQTLSDGGGIYTLGLQPNSVIEGNVIEDVPLNLGRAESNGMFLDEGTTGWTIRQNTFRGIARSPLRFHRAGENFVSENTWQLATPDTPPVRFNSTPETNITIENNRVIDN
ncbi:right-handed parallel beta-helix repeat-containing protein [Aeoliella mucimassa]|uniref:Right handed beta helix domain-containing protein n=1 Tax=Aeoliella mucimassa TaxID=2527972 RepID=A0A518AN73_9BACT|nr:right-handed parallel beta-helix repeat-containing protein [Aeoliella mucimassa]QDU56174.1 hypothetical protein Pan181_23790 [Aeoliella mucimassa]